MCKGKKLEVKVKDEQEENVKMNSEVKKKEKGKKGGVEREENEAHRRLSMPRPSQCPQHSGCVPPMS